MADPLQGPPEPLQGFCQRRLNSGTCCPGLSLRGGAPPPPWEPSGTPAEGPLWASPGPAQVQRRGEKKDQNFKAPGLGDMGLIPGPGRFHMPWRNRAWASQLLSPHSLKPVPCNKRSHCTETPTHQEKPPVAATREGPRAAMKSRHRQKLKINE
ncbi:unnamed protein product [Rangifer tarandus platyrhynchus]|uniref:Uncharacterized protein n=2 Tax=Rangifer tarandus platyrhynchus TaxID=3082113 RepID=A0ABN8YR28_RANTA|nr:unnamed protein product [Rangifer tarandus platyrhynchus]